MFALLKTGSNVFFFSVLPHGRFLIAKFSILAGPRHFSLSLHAVMVFYLDPLVLHFPLYNFIHQLVSSHYMSYPIFLSPSYCLNHFSLFFSHTPQDFLICYHFCTTNAFHPTSYPHFQRFFLYPPS